VVNRFERGDLKRVGYPPRRGPLRISYPQKWRRGFENRKTAFQGAKGVMGTLLGIKDKRRGGDRPIKRRGNISKRSSEKKEKKWEPPKEAFYIAKAA